MARGGATGISWAEPGVRLSTLQAVPTSEDDPPQRPRQGPRSGRAHRCACGGGSRCERMLWACAPSTRAHGASACGSVCSPGGGPGLELRGPLLGTQGPGATQCRPRTPAAKRVWRIVHLGLKAVSRALTGAAVCWEVPAPRLHGQARGQPVWTGPGSGGQTEHTRGGRPPYPRSWMRVPGLAFLQAPAAACARRSLVLSRP